LTEEPVGALHDAARRRPEGAGARLQHCVFRVAGPGHFEAREPVRR
jgi:hypothetical protein